MPSWCTRPGPGMEDPKPSAMPITMWSSGIRCATRSPAPSPFWKAMTMSPGRSSGATAAAAASTSAALVAMTQTSQLPASPGTRPTWRLSTT